MVFRLGKTKSAAGRANEYSKYAIATSLAEQKIHLLIEKPLSTNTKGIERLARIAKDRNIVVAIAYIYRCFPALESMRAARETSVP